MDLTPDMLEKIRVAHNANEFIMLVQENGLHISAEEANKFYSDFHEEHELSDEELNNVSGGCVSSIPRPEQVAMAYAEDNTVICPGCHGVLKYPRTMEDMNGDRYDHVICRNCGKKYRHYWKDDEWTQAE